MKYKLKLNQDLKIFLKTIILSRIIVLSLITLTLLINSYTNERNESICIYRKCKVSYFDLISKGNQLIRGDVSWYKGIAMNGYQKESFKIIQENKNKKWESEHQKNWAFFPGWPIFWKLLTFGNLSPLLGIIITNLFFISGAYIMGLYLESITSIQTKYSFYSIVAFYPFSFFYSLPLPESLFLLASSLYIYSSSKIYKNKTSIYFAIFSGIISGLSRQFGIFLCLFSISEYCKLSKEKRLNWKNFKNFILSFISPFLGLLIFMNMIFKATGHPFSFIDIQSAWGRIPSYPFSSFLKSLDPKYFGNIIQGYNFLIANQIIFILAIVCSLSLLYKGIKIFGYSSISFDYISISISLLLMLLISSSDESLLISLNRIIGCTGIFVISLSLSIPPKIVKLFIPILMILLGSFTTFSALGIIPFYY